ncbi:MAG TPA: S8/S53 family peptidase, partial [Bacteroidota bacterium]|nr:S8/S53 family peptidase [Bacteroidota bacterium]
LAELHPEWNPAQIKSALVGGAKNLGADTWTEGSGRVDVLRSAQGRIVAVPASLSAGLDDLSQQTWTRSDTIKVYNFSDSLVTISARNTSALPSGINLELSDPSFIVNPGTSKELYATFVVDNSVAQIPVTTPPAIAGSIEVHSSNETLELPWALAIGAYVDLNIGAAISVSEVYLVGDAGEYIELPPWAFSVTDGRYVDRVLVPPSVYSVVAMMHDGWKNFFIVHDSVLVKPWASVVMQDSEAKYRVGTLPRDEDGILLDSSNVLTWNAKVCSKKTGYSFGFLYDSRSPVAQTDGTSSVSALNQNYTFDYYYLSEVNNPRFYSYAGSVSPVQEDHVVTLKSGDLAKHTIQFRIPDSVQAIKFIQFMNFSSAQDAWGSYNPNGPILAGTSTQQWYSTGQPVSNFPFDGNFFNFQLGFTASGMPFSPDAETQLFRLPNRFLGDDGIVRQTVSYSDSAVMEIKHQGIVYGLGPHHYFGRTENSPLRLKVKTNTLIGLSTNMFLNQLLDQTSLENLMYVLRDERGTLLSSGAASTLSSQEQFGNTIYSDQFYGIPLPTSGKYSFELVDTNSVVATRKGKARVLLTSDTRLADPNPPSMIAFSILADTIYTDTIAPGNAATIEFQVTDDVALSQVSLYYQLENDTLWHSIPVQLVGNIYSGKTPSISSPIFVSLRLVATDASGNTLDYRAEPAYHLGAWSNHIPSVSKAVYPTQSDTVGVYGSLHNYTFVWARSHDADSWDTLTYTIHLHGPVFDLFKGINVSTGDTSLILSDVMRNLQPDATYSWWITTTDGQVTVSSDTTWFRTSDTILAGVGQPDVPKEYALYQNYPNPFNPSTTIRYDVPKESHVAIRVYNILGQEVMTLVDDTKRPGRYAVMLDGARLASGIYIYRVRAGDFVESKKLALIR